MKEFIPIISVLLGGLLAILGGVLGHHYSNKQALNREREKRRIEKLEEMLGIAYQVVDYERFRMGQLLDGKKIDQRENPIAKLSPISVLYFPELLHHEVNIRYAIVGCRDVAVELVNSSSSEGPRSFSDEQAEKWDMAFKKLNDVVGELSVSARKSLENAQR